MKTIYPNLGCLKKRIHLLLGFVICMPSNVKIYDESGHLKDHLKNFQTTAKVECWAMLTWCHLFNSTLMGGSRLWFDELPLEGIDSFVELRKAFLENFLQQKKYIKDLVKIHHIKKKGRRINQIVYRTLQSRKPACEGSSEMS
ncbi:hypothetical protein Tco_1448099 [Tanacetum coccineum]